MEIYYLLLFIFLFNLCCVASEASLRYIFILEKHDVDVPEQIATAIKTIEKAKPGLHVSDDIIFLDRENEEDAYNQLCSSLSKGVSSIIDLSWASWKIGSGLPIIRSSLDSQDLITAINSYLESRNATDAAILVKTENDVDRTLYTLLGKSNVRVWVNSGLTRDSARSLSKMRPDPSFYIIAGDRNFVTSTYKRAVKEKLVRRDYRWNLVLNDYEPFDPAVLVLPSVILQIDTNECCKLLGVSECTCPSNTQRKQLILTNLLQYISDAFIKLNIGLSKMTCDAHKNDTLDQIDIFQNGGNDSMFYWNEEDSSLNLRSPFILSTFKPNEGLQRAASWSSNEDFKIIPGFEFEPLRDFFRIGTYPAVPWTLPKLDPVTGDAMFTEEGQPMYEGYCVDLIEKIAEEMGFDYEIITPRTGDFGKRLPNGTWDGVVGDLMTGETDIAISALTMTAEREEVIDFVAPYFEQTGILIVIRKPIRKTSLFKFMTVLRTEVWLSIVAALLLTGLMIWLLEKYSPYSARNNPDAYPYPCREFTLKESFWFALTSFTPQGGGEAPKALSGRTLVAAYWLFVVLMLATFTANLAAFLTVERMQTPVSSLEQLARQSRINYTVVEGSTVHQYFINMKFAEDTLYRVWKEITLNATTDQAQYRVWDYPIREQYGHILLAINASGPVPDAKTGFRQVNEHTEADFAFIHDSAEVKYEITRNCNLTEVGEVFAEQPYAIAVQQGSRLQEDLSRTLLDLQKERFLEQLASKYWNETARHTCPDADESEGITLESLGGVFIATLFGLGLAMITLAWEVFYYKRKERKVDVWEKPKKIAFSKAKKRKGQVTIGDRFKPVSHISVNPKTDYIP
ncbi:ionotropic receptor 25a [Pieris rapae]|uniref:ionotropic receptor 25a n=1 Tax=Pieris rapae TaxID=64459 RepID=UPI001E28067A|nr:ionotropic receptor 25a [Pieris rapae]